MDHHIDADGRFQSDKHPDLAPDKIVLSFRDPAARRALRIFVQVTDDLDLAWDVTERLRTIEKEEGR